MTDNQLAVLEHLDRHGYATAHALAATGMTLRTLPLTLNALLRRGHATATYHGRHETFVITAKGRRFLDRELQKRGRRDGRSHPEPEPALLRSSTPLRRAPAGLQAVAGTANGTQRR